jgi:sterol desaturase/sphingolipid hydroxylase (fatty acid hydroxylase superfamily)
MGHLPAVPLRLAAFAATLALLLLLERLRPRRQADPLRRMRWPPNLALAVLDSAVLVLLPVAALGASVRAQAHGYGLLNWIHAPAWLALPLAWLILDLAIYWQHRALHEVRWLWPLHRVHHSDVELDVTTGVRFHPFEIAGSMLWKVLVVSAIGAPLAAVAVFELALSLFSLWSHANLRLPPALDRALRAIVITPETHRVHHSVHRDETDSNYGSTLMLWDRLFASYNEQPRDGVEAMRIGLPVLREEREQRLLHLLAQPLR